MLQSQAGSQASLVQAKPNLSRLYLSMIAGEWALAYYVWKVGLRRTATTIGELIGGKWASLRAILPPVSIKPEIVIIRPRYRSSLEN